MDTRRDQAEQHPAGVRSRAILHRQRAMKAVLSIHFGLSVSSSAAEVAECPKQSDGKPLISIGAFFDKETEIQGDRFEVRRLVHEP